MFGRVGRAHSGVLPALAVVAALLVQGCAGGVSSRDAAGYDARLGAGDYHGAADMAAAAGQVQPDGRSANLLWSLNAGAAMAYAGDARSIPVLDGAEDMMKRRDLGTTAEKGQYHAKTYDGVMVNAYKAVAAMQAGHQDIARTELLRAEDRQRRAEDDFRAEIAAAEGRAQAEEQAQGENVDMKGALASFQSDATYQQTTKDLSNFGSYRPFINPFTSYLAGLYFLNRADPDKEQARTAFQRVRGIAGPSELINGDIALAQHRGKSPPKTWVIFENGQGSTLAEYSVTFPIPIVGRRSGVSIGTVAMPRLVENAPAAGRLLVGPAQTPTTVVGNFDYVMRSEFQRRYPSIVRAAIVEAVLKAALTNVAAQEKSGIALLAATIASNISYADTRSWTALPKDFQAARIETPKDGVVRLRTDSGLEIGQANVPTDASSIVYVKQFRPGSLPAIQVLRF